MPTEKDVPSPEWSLDQLADYARKQVSQIRQAPQRVARDVFRMGSALVIVREKLKAEKEYGAWLKANKVPRTTAYHATKLFEHYGTEDKLKGKKIAEAKRECGLMKPKAEAKPLPEWLGKVPKPVARLVAGIESFRGVLNDLDGMDKGTIAKLAEELSELSRLVSGMGGDGKPKAPPPAKKVKATAPAS